MQHSILFALYILIFFIIALALLWSRCAGGLYWSLLWAAFITWLIFTIFAFFLDDEVERKLVIRGIFALTFFIAIIITIFAVADIHKCVNHIKCQMDAHTMGEMMM